MKSDITTDISRDRDELSKSIDDRMSDLTGIERSALRAGYLIGMSHAYSIATQGQLVDIVTEMTAKDKQWSSHTTATKK